MLGRGGHKWATLCRKRVLFCIYTEEERQGQPLDAKRFKTGATFEYEFFDMELLASVQECGTIQT